jgi:hypothetical protein
MGLPVIHKEECGSGAIAFEMRTRCAAAPERRQNPPLPGQQKYQSYIQPFTQYLCRLRNLKATLTRASASHGSDTPRAHKGATQPSGFF